MNSNEGTEERMHLRSESTGHGLDVFRGTSGGFAMLALDQRESLREMFPAGDDGQLVDDHVLSAFKADAARILSPSASGVLLDHPLGVPGSARPTDVDPHCALLLAADDLHSERGAGVLSSSLDPAIDVDLIHSTGASGIKYLVIWRPADESYRRDLDAFLELAADARVASFVEGIVRPPAGRAWLDASERHDAIVEAASALSPGADVYKAEVPGYLSGDVSRVREESERVTDVVDGAWVVLSNGVDRADFADAVRESCAGGAQGFLAGRAIWADTVGEPDPTLGLTTRSIARLESLTRIVAGFQGGRVGARGAGR